MSLESFREKCKQSKFYYFITPESFDKRIDWENRSVKNIDFKRGLVDEGKDNCPTRWSAYGTEHKPEVNRCLSLDNKHEGEYIMILIFALFGLGVVLGFCACIYLMVL